MALNEETEALFSFPLDLSISYQLLLFIIFRPRHFHLDHPILNRRSCFLLCHCRRWFRRSRCFGSELNDMFQLNTVVSGTLLQMS